MNNNRFIRPGSEKLYAGFKFCTNKQIIWKGEKDGFDEGELIADISCDNISKLEYVQQYVDSVNRIYIIIILR